MNATYLAYLLFGVGKQLSDVLLTLTDKLVENLGTIDDFWFSRIEHLTNLPSHQGLSCTGRTKQQDTLDVLNTKFFDKSWREDTTGECSSEDSSELSIETSDAHVFELEIRC